MFQYIVVSRAIENDSDIGIFESEVEGHLNSGFKLTGGVAVTSITTSNDEHIYTMVQAMVYDNDQE